VNKSRTISSSQNYFLISLKGRIKKAVFLGFYIRFTYNKKTIYVKFNKRAIRYWKAMRWWQG